MGQTAFGALVPLTEPQFGGLPLASETVAARGGLLINPVRIVFALESNLIFLVVAPYRKIFRSKPFMSSGLRKGRLS